MKKAIMALDGGGSNLRILVADAETNDILYYNSINTGTNLSTVANQEEALENIKNLILSGYSNIDNNYYLSAVGLSSAGTEIPEHKKKLEETLTNTINHMKNTYPNIAKHPPFTCVTNDIDILLHSADMALVAGTGTVAAVKFKDVQPYDNTNIEPEDTIYKIDGKGPHLGDKGSGFWIGKEVLTKVSEIENLGGFINRNGDFIEVEDSPLRELVWEKLYKTNGITSKTDTEKFVKSFVNTSNDELYLPMVYSATKNGKNVFDRASVGKLFSSIADEAAYSGDEAANDILKSASIELFKNVLVAYKKGNFENKENCDLLLSGSVLVHSDIIRTFLESTIKEYYPNVNVKVNNEEPVWSTIRYLQKELDKKNNKFIEER